MENNSKKVKYDGKPLEYDFDGIKELNNPIPPWLVYLWYISLIFSAMYFVYYHIYKLGDLQDAEYERQMAKAVTSVQKHHEESGQLNMVILAGDEDMADGEAIYKEKLCATCHGALGEGNAIGPNLTDNYWIHGTGDVASVFDVIKNGVPTKGMTPFKDQLSDEKILQVSSYILQKLQGTNPPNAKEPQGVLVE
nr:c-type cytochrome [Bacteroidota bacterium]